MSNLNNGRFNNVNSEPEPQSTHRRRSDKYKNVGESGHFQTPDSSISETQTREVRPLARRIEPQLSDDFSSRNLSENDEKEAAVQPVPRPASLNRASAHSSGASLSSGSYGRYSSHDSDRVLPASSQFRGAKTNTSETSRPNAEEVPVQSRDVSGSKAKKKHPALIAAIVVVLVIALAVLALLLTPDNSTSPISAVKNKIVSLFGENTKIAAQVIDFSAAPTTGTAPQNIAFTVTTNTAVQAVRIVDGSGNVVCSQNYPTTSNSESKIWAMTYYVDSAYNQTVYVEISDTGEWAPSTAYQSSIDISAPAAEVNLPVNNLLPAAPETEETANNEEIPEYVDSSELEEYAEPTESTKPAEGETQQPTNTPVPFNNLVPVSTSLPTESPRQLTMMNTATPSLPPVDSQPPVNTIAVIPLTEYTPAETESEESSQEGSDNEKLEEESPESAASTEKPPVLMSPEKTEVPSINPETGDDTIKTKSQSIYVGTNTKAESDYTRKEHINMPAGDDYVNVPFGVIAFRGNAFRKNSAYGTVNTENLSEMDIKWQVDVGSLKGQKETYYGIGQGSQPAIVKWSKDIRATLPLKEDKAEKSKLKEVIVPSLDGKIYFLDLDDGTETRDTINVGFPMRGTPSLHPLGLPIMAVGQNARNLAKKSGDIGLRIFDLAANKQTSMINGIDKRAYGTVGSFNTSALIDKTSDTMVALGTNGMLYTVKLNSEVDAAGKVSFKPETIARKAIVSGQDEKNTGTDSSLAMYQNYVYYADKAGYLHCVDVSTMKDVWVVKANDETQAALSMDFVNDTLCIFTGNILKNRQKGAVQIRCIDAETGDFRWETEIAVTKDTKTSKKVGAVASPVIGENNLSEYVYFTVTGLPKDESSELTGEECTAALVCLSKDVGEIVWAVPLDSYSYSSPVAVYNENGTGWIIQGTGKGTLLILDGKNGKVSCTLEVDGAIEGSPAVYLDTLVIGTTGKGTSHIYGIELK